MNGPLPWGQGGQGIKVPKNRNTSRGFGSIKRAGLNRWRFRSRTRGNQGIKEAKRAVEMLPISEDAWGGPSLMYNLAAVYALTNEPSLAFEQSAILVNSPGGMFYGQL
jgi:hypothetical protein